MVVGFHRPGTALHSNFHVPSYQCRMCPLESVTVPSVTGKVGHAVQLEPASRSASAVTAGAACWASTPARWQRVSECVSQMMRQERRTLTAVDSALSWSSFSSFSRRSFSIDSSALRAADSICQAAYLCTWPHPYHLPHACHALLMPTSATVHKLHTAHMMCMKSIILL
jgi:hypothetical protein